MSIHDAHQSRNCSRQSVGSLKTNHFGDDDTVMRFAPHIEDQLEEMLMGIPHEMRPKFDILFRIAVKETIIELSHKNQETTRMDGACGSNSRPLELKFSNNIIPTLFTGDPIKAIGGVPLKVTLIDSRTKEAVKSGVEASGKVEIVVLESEVDGVSGEDVKNNRVIVLQMERSRSTRVDNLCLNLIHGSAILPMVSFARNEKWMKSCKLRLGAKFVDNCNGVLVKEANTESFLLKDCRTKAYTKHCTPALHDEVWRLYKVDRNGCLAENMRQVGIITVGDFLVHLFRQSQCLKEIFEHSKHAKSWTTTVNHARECPAKLKYCSSFEPNTKVVFNVSGEVLGLFMDKHFLSNDILTQKQKDVANNLINSAFENWGDVVHVEDQFDAHFPHCSSFDQACHKLPKTEPVTASTFGKNVLILDDLDLDIDETCLFGNMVSDGQCPNIESLPESLWGKYNQIYHGFESVCISNQLEQEAAQKNKLYKSLRILFCVVTFKIGSFKEESSAGIHSHKKQRTSL